MRRNIPLSTLVEELRAEMGASTSVAQGIGSVPALQQTLRRNQERLYQEWNWPHLVIERDEPLVNGQRYYTFNNDVNHDRIISVFVKYGEIWRDVKNGFDSKIYNAMNSEIGSKNDPVQLWRHYEDNQFEVWPVPASSDQVFRFRCIRNLRPLIANDDTCDLDATTIVLFSAAEMLQRLKAEDAQFKLQLAQQHYKNIKGNSDKLPTFIMGGSIRSHSDSGWPGGDWQLRSRRI
jgi:hypothetical protein